MTVVVGGVGGGDRGDQFVDAAGELVDLSGQRVDLVEHDPGEFAVVVVELSGERFDQVGVFGFHPSPGQAGEGVRVSFAADERLDHVPGGHRVQGGRDRRHFDQRVFQQLLQPLPVPGAFAGQVHP
jgi:hypothetical protein